MRSLIPLHRQRGATLIVGLIMLVLITLLVTSAFTLSSTNLKSVGNMQMRNEAVAAANVATEQVLASPFTDDPKEEAIDVDLNNDDAIDYEVVFEAPKCVSATEIAGTGAPPSSVLLGSGFVVAANNFYQTVWDLDATVEDQASGAEVRVRQGIKVLLTQAQYKAVCPNN